ncbi:hypothetical protein DM02DRAFT_525045 [Periconia macrospinosa]|uniref:Carrier domain-containing protein n=1 Tax=Periconia macrospinosa TaxID=97972 RepID=A0A2V1DX42_9PLEO|nr:hypothetical protein DM02DRAFT_525045 [Periconia macrospinosa]
MLLEREPIPESSILNRNPKILEGPRLLHQLVRHSSSINAPAIDFLEDGSRRRTLTYGELHTSSDVLAKRIALALDGLEDSSLIIPVILPQSPELYITLLAILKAGRAFCPIGLDTPKERLQYIIQDVRANLIITNVTQRENLAPSSGLQIISVEQVLSDTSDCMRIQLPDPKPAHLAYVLYTSGSTGLPKAVSVSHLAVTQSLLAHDRHIPRFSRFLQFAAPTFDVSIFEIFFPLYRGSTLVGCVRNEMLNDLPGTINSLQVDAAELTPTVVDNLLRGRSSVPNLKLLLTIGEMLTSSVVKEYGGDGSKESILWAMYGPTEAAIHCTLQPRFQSNSPVGNIGFPLDTVSIFVASPVSESSEHSSVDVLPIGEIGELVIGGNQVADEYLNRPKLTAGSFIKHPEHGYLYRTGDKARLHCDGTLECLGRIVSGQIKLRGQRVELGEIEQVIRKVKDCLGVTVMVIEERLVAFCAVVSRNTTTASILDMCKHWLPPHMVPNDVVIVDRMPQLASGKTDQKMLRTQYLESRCNGDTQILDTNGTANDRLVAIIQKSLNRSTSNGKYADIVGIDSLGSIRVASALREQGYSITPIDVLSSQNLTSLIRMCEKRRASKESSESLGVEMPIEDFPELHNYRDDIESVLPCTALQEAMLAETSIRPSAYCNWIEVELNQPIEPSQVEQSLHALARNNEILRSGFIPTSSTTASFAQVVWKELPQSAINEVASFSRSFSLGSTDSLLRPFAIQLICESKSSRLLFQLHHAIYDGWSFDLLMYDLQGLIAGRALDPRPQYREVVRYHTSVRRSETIEGDKQYWAEKLHDYSPIRLPNYNGKVVKSNGLQHMCGETSVDAQSLYSCAKRLSVHPQVFFQAAVAYIFSLYVSSEDVVIGTVTSGRTIPVTRVEDIMGPCIASLPFRSNIAEHETVKDLLMQTQQANRDMLHHCTVPLRDITKICGLQPGEHLFEILFVWQQSLISNSEQSPDLRIVDSADDLEYKITLEFEPQEDTILYRINYDPSVIPEAQANYLSTQIQQVVNYFLSNTNSEVGDIIKAFQPDTISLANAEPHQSPIEYGPAHAVEKWASEASEREAVVFGTIDNGSMRIDKTLTYGALNTQANQLAHLFLERGVKNDQPIGIVLEKSTTLYVAILAVLKIGCGYLPITPETPLERTRTILTDAEVALTVSEPSVSHHLQKHGFAVLDLDNLDLSRYPNHNPGIPYHGSHLAYAIFTSGSTGKPKGVLVTQDNLMSNLEYLSTLYPTSSNSRMLQSCSQAFDVSVFEIFFSWYVGIALCTARKDDLFYDFEGAINSLEITHLSLTPTVAGLVDPIRVPKVHFLVTAGEALTENVKRKWAGRGLFQGYGPSETTNICTIRPNVTSEDTINNIGKSFPNTSTLILAPEKDHFVPRGAIGELCFGGSQVFRGYLKRPDLNATKIIDHPLYGRIYRSGDMGILLPDDTITFTGRIDDQVKIRGQRVELGEITSIMLDHSAVSDCATVLLQQDSNSQSLVCFWVPENVAVADFEALAPNDYRSVIIDLFETLSLQLPSYMVPSHLIPITRIPMTVQAKVDKRILHSTYGNLPSSWLESSTSTQDTEEGTQQLSWSERTIVEILARTLSVEAAHIRRSSSFFNLGVDSISAISLAKGLRDAGFGQVQVSAILKNPSVKRLSAVLAGESEKQVSIKEKSVDIADVFSAERVRQIKSDFESRGEHVEAVLSCTALQGAMLSSASPSDSSYQNTMVFRVNGDLDNLMKCWSHMFERHQIFRTAFLATDDAQYAFAQIVLTAKEFQFDKIDSNADPTIHFQQSISDQLRQNLPPVKIGVQESGASKRIVFSCHHALYDGTAISALFSEIQSMYQGVDLPAPVPYGRYLEHMINLNFDAADHFWTESLRGFGPVAFPSISSKVHKPEVHSGFIERTMRTTLGDAHRFCQDSSISLLSLLQSSWAKMLHFSLGESDLCFGNVVSGRTLPEEDLHRLVAPCFNTIPVRINFDFRRSNTDLCKLLHAFNIDVSPFELTPLRRIQAKTLKAQGRLFDTLFILQQPSQPLDESIWSLEQDVGEMDLPVVCEISQDKSRDTLTLVLHYNTSLMQDVDAKAMAEAFDMALTALLKFPNASANDTVGFPSQSLSQSNMNAQSSSAFAGKLMHHDFEQNATQQPDTVALEFLHENGKRTVLSFAELNEWANQIAHGLLHQNINVEDIVPIHASKSPQFYASILGVLKSGAAFSPIHPDLPTERKKFMLAELQPKVVLFHDSILDCAENIAGLNVNKVGDFPKDNPVIKDLRPTSLAYCLYTSGSTGVPKAVSMEHRAPIQTIASSRDLIPWNQSSKLLQYAAITFDMCYYDCFLAWTFGFTLCTADQGTMLNDLAATINTLNVDLLDLTPSVAASLRRTHIPGVKWLYCIGEAMTADIIREWESACVNSYGPTEAAFCTTMFSANNDTKASIIGKPFPSTSFAVFPKNGERPLPVFGVGELYIGGTQLAREYLHNSQLSEEKFVQKCGQRFYRSGDMVRMLSDGNFEFIGRADDQVKIRGLRVELGEINHVVQNCDERITIVTTQILKKDDNSKGQLVTFVQPTSPLDIKEQSELRRTAKEAASTHLPAYMVPQFFIFINELPRSMAGKIDKKILTQIFRNSEEVNQNSQEEESGHEWTKIESLIRGIYSKLSDTALDEISPSTTIYQLGLDSISAVQIAAALRKQGHHVNAADAMKHMNCQDLAFFIEGDSNSFSENLESFDFAAFEAAHREEIIDSLHIGSHTVEAVRPCTPLQSGILSHFIAKDGDIYFNYLRLKLGLDVDLQRMRAAWSTAMQRHAILRTGFAHTKDSKVPYAMVQYREDAFDLPWQESESHLKIEQWLAKSQQEAVKKLHRPPWLIRALKEGDDNYLDLALLHAIFDAQSLQLIFDDVAAAYNDTSTGPIIPLDPVLSHILQTGVADTASSTQFWRQLGKVAAPTRFPNLTPLRCEPMPSEIARRFSSTALNELENGCRDKNTSLQVAAMASWASLLAGYTGEKSVTFGVVLSGRNIDSSGEVVFPSITTVPFACNVSKRHDEILESAMRLNIDTQQHQFTPLNDIYKLMGFSNEQLFDSLFAFQKLAKIGKNDGIWTVVDEKATTEYPVSIELEPINGKLEYRLTYLPHMVPKEQASLILEQLDELLRQFIFGVVSDGHLFNSALYSITPAKESVLPSKASLLHELVEFTAMEHPDRVAIEFATSLRNGTYASKKWTYSQLDAEGNRIAHLLISHGVKPGELVGVCFDKCPEASFAMLGILKAGAAFVALDPGAPNARKSFIMQDSGSKVLLSMSPQSADMRRDLDFTLINLDETDLHSNPFTKPSLERNIDVHDRSYCLYTSGTTGTPKGCELTHENAVQALLAFQRLFAGHWDENSRWLQFASFHFDVSVLEQYWSWFVGISVVSAPRDLIFEDLAASIKTLDITHIDLTPSLARILHPDDVPSLCKGVFITGGESLKQEILDVWGPKSVIYNGYGPTEATIGVTMYPRVPSNGKPSNIGPQFDNVGSYVLQPGSDVPVLRGGVGELCVSGKLVGKGYLNRSDLTEKAFPTLERFNERVYRTGDLVRILHDGTFDFLGRADDQVKLRGQRLEIGEINAVIKQSDAAVVDVVTLVLRHPKQQKEQLVAFIVVGSQSKNEPKIALGKSKELSAAKQMCQAKLPPYMVPTHFVALNAMPLNINNKADAKKLKEMYQNLSSSDLQTLSLATHEDDGNWTEKEEKIRDILREAMEIDVKDITKDASFFELGMDSISVIRVARALKSGGFTETTASTTMKNPTIRRLAKVLSEKSQSTDDLGSIVAAQQAIAAVQHRHRRSVARNLAIDADEMESLAPCTPLQQGMIARSWDSGNGLYFNTFRFNLNEKIDITRLREAWQKILDSTQILRTVFVNTDDGFVQLALKQQKLRLDEVTLLDNDDQEDILEQRRNEWVKRNQSHILSPFGLLLVKSATQNLLVVQIFHALYDGISIELVFQNVWNAYNNRSVQSGPPFQSSLAHGPLRSTSGAKEFWEECLAGAKFRPFPTVNDSSDEKPISLSKSIEDLCHFEETRRKLNVTAQTIVQACWAVVLSQFLNSAVTLGTVLSGRSIEFDGADRVNGPMFNTIPYHYRPQHRETWASIIQRTHAFNVAAHPHQHTALRDIMKWCKRGPNQPLFETLFVYQAPDAGDEWRSNDVWKLLDADVAADYPVAMEVENSAAGLKMTLVAQRHVLSKDLAQQLLDDFGTALRQATNEFNATVSMDAGTVDDEPNHGSSHNHVFALNSPNVVNGFEWTDKAITLRREIAYLAQVEPDTIDENTSVFELGLDSIDAIKLSSRLKKQSIHLPVSGVMRSLNIANMSQHAMTDEGQVDKQSHEKILSSQKTKLEDYIRNEGFTQDIENVLPLTPLQEAMVAEMIASEYRRYYNHGVLKLAPETNVDNIQQAWEKVVRESPILRTSFVPVHDPSIESSFAQIIRRQPHDFTKLTSTDIEPDFPTIFEERRRMAMRDSELTPLFFVNIVHAPKQTYIVLSIAHALYDGWSLGLLHQDVDRAYSGQFVPRPSYETSLARILESSEPDAIAFWRDYLSDASPCVFPRKTTDLAYGSQKVYRAQRSSTIPLHEATKFTKKANVSLQTLGQTAHALTMASYTRSMDVAFGAVLSGRDDDKVAELLFPIMNTVVIRCILHGTRQEMLRYVQQNFSTIRQYQHFPLRKALHLAGLQGKPLESLFIYQKSMNSNEVGMKLYENLEGRSEVEFAVCVEMEVVGDQLVWQCAVKEDILDEAGAQELLDRLDGVMKEIINQPHAAVAEFAEGGTSICGLPVCKDKSKPFAEEQLIESPEQTDSKFQSQTARIIREVLSFVSKTPEADITEETTIFHIGLDSISAIKVSSLLRKRGINLSVSEMLKSGTAKRMASIVDARLPATDQAYNVQNMIENSLTAVNRTALLEKIGSSPKDIETWLPATAGQIYMLSMWHNSNGTMFYPEFTYRVHGSISLDSLNKAWKSLTDIHPILRTCLLATEDAKMPYIQVVLRQSETRIHNITGWKDNQITDFTEEQMLHQPLTVLLVSESCNGWDLRLKIHHALYDGVSLPILIQQFQDICKGGEVLSSSMDTLTDFVAANSNPSVSQNRESFWNNYLQGTTGHHLPQPSSPTPSRCEVFKPNLSSKMAPIESLARANNLTTQSLFLASFARLYADMTHTPSDRDIVIGIYLANRSFPNIQNLADSPIPVVNLVPLRVRRPLEINILDAAARIQSDIHEISSAENVGVGLWEIKEWTDVKIDCWVNFLKLPEAEHESADQADGKVRIEQSGKWDKEVRRVTEANMSGTYEMPRELSKESVQEAYLHSLDVEVTVCGDSLDVGLFVPEEMIPLRDAERLMHNIKVGIEGLVNAEK